MIQSGTSHLLQTLLGSRFQHTFRRLGWFNGPMSKSNNGIKLHFFSVPHCLRDLFTNSVSIDALPRGRTISPLALFIDTQAYTSLLSSNCIFLWRSSIALFPKRFLRFLSLQIEILGKSQRKTT